MVGKHRVLRQDCQLVENAIHMTIRSSKTRNKHTDVPRVISLPMFPGHSLCPVAALIHFMKLSSVLPISAPLCAIPTPKPKQPFYCLSYKAIVDSVRKAVPSSQAFQYATHSFRRGGASYMFRIGLSTDTIRLLGDWKSDCYKRYITLDSAVFSNKAITAMQQNLPHRT